MANPLGADLRGQVVMISPAVGDGPLRPWRVESRAAGLGAYPDLWGTTMYGRYMDTPLAKIVAISSERVIRIATVDDLAEVKDDGTDAIA